MIEKKDSLLVFAGIFDSEVKHPLLGVIRPGTISYEFYWLEGWFNVFRFHEPEGDFRNFYCNLNMPPVFGDGVMDYIDLDIDIVVSKDFSYDILDIEEFKENAVRFNYSEELITNVRFQMENLIEKIHNRDFPFDYFSK